MKFRILIFFFLPFSLAAQGVLSNLGNGKAAGLNGINTAFDDVYALSGNQAGIAWSENFGAFAFAEQRFLLEELAGLTAGVVIPTKAGNFGASLGYLGFERFSEQKIGLAYGRKLLKNLSIGGQLDLFNQQTGNFGNFSTFTFEFGLQMVVNPKLTIGVHTLNPIQATLDNGEELTSNFRLGFSYKPIKSATIFAEAEQNVEATVPVFRGGLAYRPIERLEVRVGVRSKPNGFSFGAGYRLKGGFGLELAAVYHEVLGFTPSAGFVYRGGE